MGGGGGSGFVSFKNWGIVHLKAKESHHSKNNFSNKDSLCSWECSASYTGNSFKNTSIGGDTKKAADLIPKLQ